MLKQFIQFFKERNISLTAHHYLLAVSGGIDSVVLCELSKQAGIKFSIAHCNFGLRGEESDRDERFVKDVAEKYNAELFVKKFDTESYAATQKISIQEAARVLRYQWFAGLVGNRGTSMQYETGDDKQSKINGPLLPPCGTNFLLTAHHADDNIETLLINFFRGTGLQGLTGMPSHVKHQRILRPLLHMRKTEIREFAAVHNLKWVDDSSNASSKYTRNYFRNEIIPAIKEVYPHAEENLLDNIERYKKTAALYNLSLDKIKKEICEQHPSEVRIGVKKLMSYQHTSLIYEIIKDYGFGEKAVDEVIKLAGAETGKYLENENYQIIKNRNWFIIATKISSADTVMIEKEKAVTQFSGGSIAIKYLTKEKIVPGKTENVAQVDAKQIEFPLLLRKWKQGDYFYPLGMRKKKKLSRFFIDQKLSKNEKEAIWVLESNSRIVWVIGHRIDDRFKILPTTKEMLQISWSSL